MINLWNREILRCHDGCGVNGRLYHGILVVWGRKRRNPDTYEVYMVSWWRHDLDTFSALLALCRENPTVAVGPKVQQCGVLISSIMKNEKVLDKQSRFRWFEMAWRSCQVIVMLPHHDAAQQLCDLNAERDLATGKFTHRSVSLDPFKPFLCDRT